MRRLGICPSGTPGIRTIAAAICLGAALVISTTAGAAQHTADDLVIDIPQNWEVKQHFMGLLLFARPTQEDDPQGWSADHIAVAKQEFVSQRKTGTASLQLDEMVRSKLAQIGHHTTDLKVVKQEPVLVGKTPARQLEVRYSEGLRSIQALVLIFPTSQSELTSVTLVTSPDRISNRRPLFRQIIKDLVILKRP